MAYTAVSVQEYLFYVSGRFTSALSRIIAGRLVAPRSFASGQDCKPAIGNNAIPRFQAATPPASRLPDRIPLKRPISEKQKKENAKSLKSELGKTYKKWLDEDVA